ncbi:MAG: YggU family protein [Desulfobacteraceae bacterium]|nr:MAG: YggU family protein [Desulfobacteraceae bacterium]
MLDIKKQPNGVVFKIHVQPKASKNVIVGLHDNALKIRLTAPPVDGAANKMCVHFLSKELGVPKSAIEIVAGQTSRTKHICISFPPDASPAPSMDHPSEQLIRTIKSLAVGKTS